MTLSVEQARKAIFAKECREASHPVVVDGVEYYYHGRGIIEAKDGESVYWAEAQGAAQWNKV